MPSCRVIFCFAIVCAGASASDGALNDLRFEPNVGQAAPGVSFLSRSSGRMLFLSPTSATLRVDDSKWMVEFIGANAEAEAVVVDPLPTQSHYLIGTAAQWHTGVPAYGRVEYRDIYPGVTVVYSGDARELRCDLEVQPGADPSRVQMRFQDSTRLEVDDSGELLLRTERRQWRHSRPDAYQIVNGVRTKVPGARFRVSGSQEVAFATGDYNAQQTLVLTFSTYLGGSGLDIATSIAVDSAGNSYVAGWTESTDFPGGQAARIGQPRSVDAYVAKLNSAGNLVYIAYLGGSGDDRAFGIAVDGAGAAIIGGWTYSTNFPTANAEQAALRGGRDAFVAKLNAAGNGLVFATYLGGSGSDSANGVTLDSQGRIYVAGETTSANFPLLSPFQSTIGGGSDAFVAKFNSTGGRMYSTFLGGIADDRATAVAVDGSGYSYITGSTNSPNFPVVNAFQSKPGGAQDAFAAKIGLTGNTLLYSTYLGGTGGTVGAEETGNGIAVDSSGCAYIAGATSSSNFPLMNALQSKLRGSEEGFVLKLSAAGNALVYSTYLGGSSVDVATGIAVDGSGRATAVGYTASTDFPAANSLQASNGGDYDAFIVRLSYAGNSLETATYLGGTASDSLNGVALDGNANIYIAGQTRSFGIATANPSQGYPLSALSAFVGRIGAINQPPQISSLTPSSGSGTSQTFAVAVSDASGAAGIASIYVLVNTQLSSVNGCQVAYDRPSNLIWLIGDNGSTWIFAGGVGSGSMVSNSQCSLDAKASGVASSGTTLTLNLKFVFKGGFSGARNIYANVVGQNGLSYGWQRIGAWTVSSPPPSVSGAGGGQTLSLAVSDTNGASDIASIYVLVNSQLSFQNGCLVAHDRASNLMWLIGDNGTDWIPAGPVGSGAVASNSQCSLDPVNSTVTSAGSVLTLNLRLTFKASFSGIKNVFVNAVTQSGVSTAWQQIGTWTTVAAPPVVVATGTSGMLTIGVSDTKGAADIGSIYVLVNSQLTAVGGCLVTHDRLSNLIWLIGDNGTDWILAGTLGSGVVVSNSQCSLDPVNSSVVMNGTLLTLNLKLTFKPAFSGTKQVFGAAADLSNYSAGWRVLGSLTL